MPEPRHPHTSRPQQRSDDDAAGYYTPGEPLVDTKAPDGPIEERWDTRKFEAGWSTRPTAASSSVIIVGTGLAGGAAAATLGEAGYNVKSFCYQDSPRRAHSIAAQGGINAAKNYKEDGDSVYRLFYDTVKGGDYRSRESNVYRLAEVSANIIDQCVAQGVPFAREYGGLLDNRSFGGVQVSRTFYARGQTGQQLLIGAYQAMERQVAAGTVRAVHPPRDARADRRRRQGPRHHRPRPGHRRDRDPPRRRRSCWPPAATATSSTCPPTRWAPTSPRPGGRTARAPTWPTPATRRSTRPASRSPATHQSKLTLMSESLRNDGRIWVPKNADGLRQGPARDPRGGPRLLPRADLPGVRQPGPPRHRLARGQEHVRRGSRRRPEVGGVRRGVYLDFADAIERLGAGASRRSTATSSTCTPGSPARTPTRSRCGSTPPCTT